MGRIAINGWQFSYVELKPNATNQYQNEGSSRPPRVPIKPLSA